MILQFYNNGYEFSKFDMRGLDLFILLMPIPLSYQVYVIPTLTFLTVLHLKLVIYT